MEYKDYYKILGVDRKASQEEIRKAYRKLAMSYHPDHNQGNKQAEEKFKEINEANQVLSNPEQRARYDQLGESYSSWQQRGQPGNFNWEDWFVRTGQQGGTATQVDMRDFEDLFGGGFSDFFTSIFGGGMAGASRGQRTRRTTVRKPEPVEHPVQITFNEAFKGTERIIQIDGRRLNVKIPAGAAKGTKVRVANQGPANAAGQQSDLYLVIDVQPNSQFERKGDDLYTDVTVDLYTAVLGGQVNVPTPAGSVVLTIPAGTQPGQAFRLSGRGMPNLRNPSSYGNLFARVKVTLPKQLTDEQRKLFEQLKVLK